MKQPREDQGSSGARARRDVLPRKIITIGFLFAVATTLFVSWFLLRTVQSADGETDRVLRGHILVGALSATLQHVVDVETGARGFALTGADQFLEPYLAGNKALPEDLATLRRTIGDDSDDQAALDQLDLRIQGASAAAEAIAAQRRALRATPRPAVFETNKLAVDEVRSIIQQMQARQAIQLSEHNHKRDRLRELATLLRAVDLGTILCLFTLAWAVSLHAFDRIYRSREQIDALNFELRQRLEQRTFALSALQFETQERAKTEQLLRQSEESIRLLLDGIKDYAIYMLDPEGSITSWNAGATRITGYEAIEALGKSFTIFFLPSERADGTPEHALKTALSEGRIEIEGQRVRKDGTKFWTHSVMVPLHDGKGKLLGFSKVLQDITARKNAEQALHDSLQASVRALKDLADFKFAIDQHAIVATTDVRGRITYVNNKFCEISKYSREELLGQDHRIINSGHHPKEFFHELYQTIARGKVWHAEICNRAKDGSHYWVDTTVVPLLNPEGKPRQYIAIWADITERKNAERELAEIKYAVDQHAIIAITDVQGTITYVNDKFCDISQYSREELLGKNHRIINSGHHPREFFKNLYRTAARGEVWRAEICNRAKDGSFYWVDTTVVPLMNPQGKPQQYISIRTDITESKRTASALREQARVLELTQVFVRDMESRITMWNEGTAALYGFTKDEAMGMVSHQLLRTIFPAPLAQIEEKFHSNGKWEGELIHRKQNGEQVVVASTWLLERDTAGGPLHILEINTDITQRKKDEQEIRALKDEMETRVIRRTSELDAANRELEAFTYSVSHDLRAPLRHIAGFSSILVEEFMDSLPPGARQHVVRIQDGTRRMGLLVDEMLNLARVGRHTLSLQKSDLNATIEELRTMLAGDCNDRNIEWRVAELPKCECDPVLIKQVLQNLIANAIKFTRTREKALIEIGTAEHKSKITIFVRDNGVGFDMKYADKLFGVFQRLHRAEDFEGTGVGLATVQRIVRRHGGEIWVQSAPDHGATFFFTVAGLANDFAPKTKFHEVGA